MIDDFRTMLWKEWKETIFQRNLSQNERFVRAAVVIAILGVLLWKAGPLMVTAPMAFFMPSFLPLFFLVAIVGDSFAGERERHTLETLLATRLSDGAILAGKILAVVLLIWGVILLTVTIGSVSANLTNHAGGLILPPLDRAVPFLTFYFLLSLAAGSAG